MQGTWLETETVVETVNWKGEPLQLSGVKAIKNTATGEILVNPIEIARAEIRQIAKCYDLEPRDVATLLMIEAKPGIFKQGEVLFKYHLQKQLFYLMKALEKNGYGQSLPIDDFIPAKNGPKPKNLDDDLNRLVEKKLITIKKEKWDGEAHESKRIILTAKGASVAESIWSDAPDPFKEVAIKVKERIHPLAPETVRHLVHTEYPEYKCTYTENDIE